MLSLSKEELYTLFEFSLNTPETYIFIHTRKMWFDCSICVMLQHASVYFT